MYIVIEVRSGRNILPEPMLFLDAMYWYYFYSYRYQEIEFDIIPVTLH